MSTSIKPAMVRKSLEKTGNGWLLSFWGNEADKYLKKIAADLEGFRREYKKRFGEGADIFGLLETNMAKAAAFFQVDTLLASTEMKIMVWRILLGCEIRNLDLKYQAGKHLHLCVTLSSPYGKHETYVTENASDYRVLRHFGLTGVNADFDLQGYYALKGGR